MIYFLIFIFQYIFNLLKVLEIKFSYEEKIKPLMLVTALISGIALLSLFMSFELLIEGNLFVVPVYIAGSMLGKLAAIKLNNIRGKIFHKLFNKN